MVCCGRAPKQEGEPTIRKNKRSVIKHDATTTMKDAWDLGLQDQIKLRDLAFIGTHDSTCVVGRIGEKVGDRQRLDSWPGKLLGPAHWQTQVYGIEEQLRYGCRLLDLRFITRRAAAASADPLDRVRGFHGDIHIVREWGLPLKEAVQVPQP